MTSETMVRVGRGGAGNYHSAPAHNTASLAPSKTQIARAQPPPSAPTRIGRGGAGNVVSEPNATAHAEEKREDLEAGNGAQITATEAAAAAAARGAGDETHQHHSKPVVVFAGRGGAGNYHDAAAEAAGAKAAEEAEKSSHADKLAKEEVDSGLRRPEPTHTRIRHSERRCR